MSRCTSVRDAAVGFVTVASGVAAQVREEVPAVALPLLAIFYLTVLATFGLFTEREMVPVDVGDPWQASEGLVGGLFTGSGLRLPSRGRRSV
ncbi:hypothetical protein [Nonomuraea longicatena]|uniref:Uncharacterized protein n=1 Tax=Nonomuraea longicatena TaxID=83682 RepID=A0ABN1QJ48_9ACTN